MRKAAIIDLFLYRNQDETLPSETDYSANDDLETAIRKLIYRLRELGPLTQSN